MRAKRVQMLAGSAHLHAAADRMGKKYFSPFSVWFGITKFDAIISWQIVKKSYRTLNEQNEWTKKESMIAKFISLSIVHTNEQLPFIDSIQWLHFRRISPLLFSAKKKLNEIRDEVLLSRENLWRVQTSNKKKKMDAIGDNGWRTKPIKCIFCLFSRFGHNTVECINVNNSAICHPSIEKVKIHDALSVNISEWNKSNPGIVFQRAYCNSCSFMNEMNATAWQATPFSRFCSIHHFQINRENRKKKWEKANSVIYLA